MFERENIRRRKDAGDPWPWSADPIFQNYFISNLRCEDDKTTRWLKANWRDPHENDPDLWFSEVIFRRGINLPATAEELGYPVPWRPMKFKKVVESRKERGLPWCNGRAYKLMVGHKRSSGGFHGSQEDMLLYYAFNPVWALRKELRVNDKETIASYFGRLSQAPWMGGWYAYRVICDLKYTKWLRDATDWWTFILPGPGSIRGLNRVLGRPINQNLLLAPPGETGCLPKFTPAERIAWSEDVNELRLEVAALGFNEPELTGITAQTMGGALCEFDKYERIRLGDGGKVRPYRRQPL
jgi:hypothetical protein